MLDRKGQRTGSEGPKAEPEGTANRRVGANTTHLQMNTAPVSRSRRVLKALLIAAGSLIVLLGLAWWIGTSNFFFQRFILPRLSRQLGVHIEVARAEIHPLSRVVLHEIRIQTATGQPILQAAQLRVRHHLMRLLGGQLDLEELLLDNPSLQVLLDARGHSNLDPLLQALQPPDSRPTSAAKPASPPLALRIGRLEIRNGAVLLRVTNSASEVLQISAGSIRLQIENLANDQKATLSAGCAIQADHGPASAPPTRHLEATFETRAGFALDPALQPRELTLQSTASVTRAGGSWQPWANLRATLTAQLDPARLRELALRFFQGDQPLASLEIQGPLNWQTGQAELHLALTDLDARLLNLIGSAYGFDFGPTRAALHADLVASPQRQQITLAAQADLTPLQIRKTDIVTPATDLQVRFRATWDRTAEAVTLHELRCDGRHGPSPWLEAALSAPITWHPTRGLSAATNAALHIQIRDLDLADWKAVIGDTVRSGRVNLSLHMDADPNATEARILARADLQNLAAVVADRSWENLAIACELPILLTRNGAWSLTNGLLRVAHGPSPLLHAALDGTGRFPEPDDEINLDLTAYPATGLALLQPAAKAGLQAGELHTRLRVRRQSGRVETRGSLQLRQLAGAWIPTNQPAPELNATLEIRTGPGPWELAPFDALLTAQGRPAGRIWLSAIYHPTNGSCTFTARVDRLLHAAVAPWLATFLTNGPWIESLECNASAAGSWNPTAPSRIQASMSLTNLVLRPRPTATPAAPLALDLQTDLGLSPREIRIHDFRTRLDPQPGLPNELKLLGTLQRETDASPWSGAIELQADSLDLTRLWSAWQSLASTETTAPAPAPVPPSEPTPVLLPIENGRLDVKLGRVRLRELELTQTFVRALLHTNHIRLQSLDALVNGAPLRGSAEVDLSVPGYRYRVALSANTVPLPPLISVFAPERRDQLAGTASLELDLIGQGFTGTNLQQHLQGRAGLLATNLNLSIAQVRSPLLQTVLNVVLGLPDLIRNPAAGVGRLLGQLLGAPGTRSGWTDRLLNAPVDVLAVQAEAGQGQIRLTSAQLRSAAFDARASGTIQVAPDLTRSELHLPIHLALERSLAAQIGRTGQPDQAYVPLPDFVTLRGTLGEPKAEFDKLALLGLATSGSASVLRNVGGAAAQQAGNVLGTLGQLLTPTTVPTQTNTPAATNTPPATNSPVVPPNPVQGLLDLLKPHSR
jgi:hypothetical protein